MVGYIIVGGVLTAVAVSAGVQAGLQVVRNRGYSKKAGNTGEKMVDRCLRKFRGSGFSRFRDIMLPTRGKTSQIDNLLVSRYGIFVIETKNYVGVVKGKENASKWLHIYPGSKYAPHEFYNPIWQNDGHIRALQQLLGSTCSHVPYHNIVVFSDKCRPPQIPGVITMSSLQSVLKERMTGRPILTEDEVATIKTVIEKNNIRDKSNRSQHVTYAQQTAARVKERDVEEARRLRAEANKEMAMKVQMAVSGIASQKPDYQPLNEQITTAKDLGSIEKSELNHNRDCFDTTR